MERIEIKSIRDIDEPASQKRWQVQLLAEPCSNRLPPFEISYLSLTRVTDSKSGKQKQQLYLVGSSSGIRFHLVLTATSVELKPIGR